MQTIEQRRSNATPDTNTLFNHVSADGGHDLTKAYGFQVEETDRMFTDSPDDGAPDCLCSGCGDPIAGDNEPLRVWCDIEGHKPDTPAAWREWRYCFNCCVIRLKADPDDVAPF